MPTLSEEAADQAQVCTVQLGTLLRGEQRMLQELKSATAAAPEQEPGSMDAPGQKEEV